MTSQGADDFRLTVLNPGGRDPEQHFQDTPGPGEGEHPPVNFHAFAACTRGAFHYDTRRAIAEGTPVLLLLRGEFRASERALGDLEKHGRMVWELRFPEGKFRVIEGEKPYLDYLRVVARHKIVLQLDRSRVPGQVAGDALLCRIVCVGGDGAIERIAFPKTCGNGRTIDQIASTALDLLKNADARAATVVESQHHALERLSFQAVRSQLANFFAQVANAKR